MTKKALIHGTRICEVVDTTFEVSSNLSWVDVADNTVANQDTYVDGAVVKYIDPTLTYIEKRVFEYPSTGQQFDKLYHDGIDEWKKVIKAVKDKYPKE